jgi:hypothetical protein
VQVQRSGGFAGIPVTTGVESERLSPEASSQFSQLVEQAKALPSPPAGARSRGGRPDRFQYDVTIEDGGTRRTFTVHEGDAPPALQQLIRWVVDHGAQQR